MRPRRSNVSHAALVTLGVVACLTGCSILVDTSDLADPSAAGLSSGSSGDGGPSTDAAAGDGSSGGSSGTSNTLLPPPTAWTAIDTSTLATTPKRRHSAKMTYDAKRERVVLFGGLGGDVRMADTWEWNGTSWEEKTLMPSPPERQGFGLTYDSDRNVVVLFGGQGGDAQLWELDGASWQQRTFPNLPKRLAGFTMAYDAKNKQIVGFGGFEVNDPVSDTFIINPLVEVKRTRPSNSPIGVRGQGMAYDAARERIVLFGGARATDGTASDETWLFDGTSWEKAPATNGEVPPARAGQCMTYDSDRRLVIMMGGRRDGGDLFDDTWLWNGVTWSRGPKGPPARRACAMAYDASRHQTVLFGGTIDKNRRTSNDMWLLQ